MLKLSSGSLWAGIISGGLAQLKTQNAYTNGALASNEYASQTTKNVTGAVGLIAGLEYGAILGSRFIPGVGTIVGTLIGGILGDRIGSSVGLYVGNALFDQQPPLHQLPAPHSMNQIQ
ncbi:hypothetical protein [Desulfitobacterium sp. AusDCA]|uniref:hypothetical protein n=1 Tax=Desulfitobacterium sp. AusDCA TaxID=3240383 RepID=UPI003DA749BC